MFVIDDTRTINASTEQLWQLLIDTPCYGDWNPFVVRCDSDFQPGSAIIMHVKIWQSFALRQKETVRFNKEQEFLEYGVAIPGLLKSIRQHKLQNLADNQCRYQSYFALQGPLAPFVKALMGKRLQQGFKKMTDAIENTAPTLALK